MCPISLTEYLILAFWYFNSVIGLEFIYSFEYLCIWQIEKKTFTIHLVSVFRQVKHWAKQQFSFAEYAEWRKSFCQNQTKLTIHDRRGDRNILQFCLLPSVHCLYNITLMYQMRRSAQTRSNIYWCIFLNIIIIM